MESFATRLRTAMNARHLRQVDIVRAAQASGVKLGKSHISQYVSGKTTPRADTLRFLADTLQVDGQWLLGHDRGRPDMPAQPKRVPDNPGGRADAPRTPSSQAPAPQTTSPSHEPEGTPMRYFNKSTKLDNVLYDVRGPVVDEAARMEQSGMHVLKLNIGNPAPFGFRTPDEVVYDMSRQLSDTEGYSASKGLFSARKAIMQYAQLK
ncbi:helix-turn-helix domain-containing protein, partial [Bifidobacterium bifidum]